MIELNKAFTEFLSHCEFEKNLSPKTLKFYRIDLYQFLQFLINENHPVDVQKIDKSALKHYLSNLSGFKPKTIKRKIATLKALFNFLEFDDVIIVNPFRKLRIKIKEPKRLPTVMTNFEVKKIFRSAYSETEESGSESAFKRFEVIRNIAVVELLFATGARVSELSNLEQNNVDLNEGFIRVIGKGNKERTIQICNKETLSILKGYRLSLLDKTSSNHFFINRLGKRLSDQSIRGIIKKLVSRTSINKRITPHVFRHSVATLLLEEGVDIKYIQILLGHSSILTTQIYTHVNGEKQKSIIRLKHPRKNFSMAFVSDPE